MSTSQNQGSDHHHDGLEDHLRGLILNNVNSSQKKAPEVQPDLSTIYFPPHMLGATDAQKQEYLKKQKELSVAPKISGQQPQGSKRRPNQAQRTHRNSQMTVPILTRPAVQGTQYGRGSSPATSFPSPQRQYGNLSEPLYQSSPQSSQFPARRTYQTAPPYAPAQFRRPVPQYPLFSTNTQPQSGPIRQLANQTTGFDGQNLYQQIPGSTGKTEMHTQYSIRPIPRNPQLFQPGPFSGRGRGASFGVSPEQIATQSAYLDALVNQLVPKIGISEAEIRLKEEFRMIVERACCEAITTYEQKSLGGTNFDPNSVELQCFGSMASGFATKASDMDLALLTPHSMPPPDSSESAIPRLLEKKLLEMGFGARLLTRTRVPIIKLCQKPTIKLMSDLLEERGKWENGFSAEDEADAEDDINDKAASQEEDDGKPYGEADLAELVGNVPRRKIVNYEEKLRSFKQKKNQSLVDYYGSAKRLLRILGCQDITTSTEPQENNNILQKVCKAFLSGLADEELKARLSSYQSLSLLLTDQLAIPRSLSGIFAQIEGEQLASFWSRRPLQEANYKAEIDCGRLITDWQNSMNSISFDTLVYNRNLHQAVERLKRIPSLQLTFLEQGLHEDPVLYHARAARILNELGGRDQPSRENRILEVVIQRYLAGINNLKILEELKKIASNEQPVSLKSLMIQHRILQLADDYEAAISKSLYDKEDQIHITQYVHLLRTGVLHRASTPSALNPPVASSLSIAYSTAPLIYKMQSLPDPSQTVHKPRDRYKDHLEFPKTNIGIQCDINFSAHLALHNTLLLRCYSLTDPRVKLMVLFIKHWAKARAINTPYRGSLSSYGYVLMILHYLVNIAQPFVCPNLQHLRQDPPSYLPPAEIAATTVCNGRDVQFWRNEKEIAHLADRGMLNHNQESVGALLRGFFEYFANTGQLSTGGRGFDWGREVLSLRTQGGILSKQEKGWVGARTVMETTTEAAPPTIPIAASGSSTITSTTSKSTQTTQYSKKPIKEEVKEIRHRYLFCIEDPFELDHNVARTVTHNGICAIRDEFRRAWGILRSMGRNGQGQGQDMQEGLLDEVLGDALKSSLKEFMNEIHGKLVLEEGKTAVEEHGWDSEVVAERVK